MSAANLDVKAVAASQLAELRLHAFTLASVESYIARMPA